MAKVKKKTDSVADTIGDYSRERLVDLVELVAKNVMCRWGLEEPFEPNRELRRQLLRACYAYLPKTLDKNKLLFDIPGGHHEDWGAVKRVRVDTGRDGKPTIEFWYDKPDKATAHPYERYGDTDGTGGEVDRFGGYGIGSSLGSEEWPNE